MARKYIARFTQGAAVIVEGEPVSRELAVQEAQLWATIRRVAGSSVTGNVRDGYQVGTTGRIVVVQTEDGTA